MFTLSGGATITHRKTVTVNGRFVQEGGTINQWNDTTVLTIGEGGVYDMSGGTNGASVTVNQGGSYALSGSASFRETPMTVTVCSCMASKRADCVFGVARLISSAKIILLNTGPG